MIATALAPDPAATNKVTGTVTVGTNLQDVAYTPDGAFWTQRMWNPTR